MINLILADCKGPEIVKLKLILNEITPFSWDVKQCDLTKLHNGFLSNAIRYLMYFVIPLSIVIRKNKYQYILAWQQFFGITLAFYSRLFRLKCFPKIFIMTFIYKRKKNLLSSIYYHFIKYSLEAESVHKIICYSEPEIHYYVDTFKLPPERFLSVLYGIEKAQAIDFDDFNPEYDSYYLAVGRSNRDYRFLIDAFENIDKNLIILCDSLDENPNISNIVIKRNIHGNDYLLYLKHCHGVIIPLLDTKISSGQLVYLRSMEFGKPVIITVNDTLHCYLNEKNSIIIKKDLESLCNAIKLLDNDKIYDAISISEVYDFNKRFTFEAFVNRLAEALQWIE